MAVFLNFSPSGRDQSEGAGFGNPFLRSLLMPAQLIFYRDNTWSAGRYIPGVLCVLS